MYLLIGAFLLANLPVLAMGSELTAPQGDVLLSVAGDISHPNVGSEAHFDRQLLLTLSPLTVCTRTPWHHEAGCFQGPLLREVLAAAGVRSNSIVVHALNGYRAEIPVQELHDYDVTLAMNRNGEPIPIREFGPLFVLYPFDEHPELHTEAVRFRSVWHVTKIHAR